MICNINEDQLNQPDVKAIFRYATDLRSKHTGAAKWFKGLRKPEIDINDLQQAWKEDGYSDDTRDIYHILHSHGFGDAEINKIFARVLGANDSDDEYEEPRANDAIMKIANYAKKNNFDKELIKFMEREFGFNESYTYQSKLVIEDIRQIFTEIIKEERTDRIELIRQQDNNRLGRKRK